MDRTFTAKQIAVIMEKSKQAITKRAEKESWPYTEGNGKGGTTKHYPLATLPDDIKVIILRREAAQIAAATVRQARGPEGSGAFAGYTAAHNYLEEARLAKEQKLKDNQTNMALFVTLPDRRKREAECKYEILKAAQSFTRQGQFKKDQGIRLFCELYNKGRISLPEEVAEAAAKYTSLNRATIYKWQSRHDAQFLYGLAGIYGHQEGRTKLTPEQQNIVKGMIAEYPDVQIPKIMAGLQARFCPLGIPVPEAGCVAYFVNKFRKENASVLLSIKNPDEWRSKYQFACGSASVNILRLNQLWEADATPADIMLRDGRHTAIAQIDVFSRRSKILITPTSRAQAVATLLRRGLLDWGVMEVYRSDNGKDFTARHLEQVLDSIEAEHDLCPPFTPEAKPHIERFMRTFSHGIVELLPGFIGHNVAERKAIEGRKSFAERLMKKGQIVEIKMTAREFQGVCDRWVEAVYHQTPHEGLGGLTPAEKARSWTAPVKMIEDERALDVLLCPAPKDGGMRTVGKKGVEVNRRTYFNTLMAGYEGQRVEVKIDYADQGRVYCFAESGEFLCMATCPEWYGISAQEEAGYIKQKQKSIVAAKRKELKLLSKQGSIRALPEEILCYRESLIANVAELPRKTESYTTAALEEAILAADARDGIKNKEALAGPIELPPEVLAYEERQQKVVNLQEVRQGRQLFASNVEIYDWVIARVKARTVTAIQRQWQKEWEAYLETEMRRPFCASMALTELTDEVETSAEC